MYENEIAALLKKIHVKNNEQTWVVGRLGMADGTIDVATRPGHKHVRLGDNGELGNATAIDRIGAANVTNNRVKMRRENDQLVIRDAEQLASTAGAIDTLDELTDVTLTGLANGHILQYNSTSGQWENVVPAGGAGGAPSPHDHSGSHHSGLLAWADINFTSSTLASLATRSHDDLQDVTANQHHNQVHSITGSDHTLTASQYQLVGATATNTLGLLTPSNNPGAAAAIVRTSADGSVQFDTSLIVIDAPNDRVSIDSTLARFDAATDIITFDTSLVSINAATDIVTFDTNLVTINGAANTISLDNGLIVLDAGLNTWVSGANSTYSGTAVFNGNVTLNANGTFNTGVFQFNTDPQINANLDFIGADRSITGSNNLTIAPLTDLLLDPGGLVVIPVGQEIRTGTYNDFVAGIAGFRNWDTGGNVRQLTIGAIKADELFVRFFTADESRVNRGEEFWTRSYGIVETDFTTPADEATVDVWFEEVPGLGSFKLFLPDNWILIRTIDVGTGLTVTRTWYQVVDGDGAGTNDYIQRQDVDNAAGTLARQQWRLRRKSGGSTGVVVNKGNVAVDFGKPFSVTTPTPGQGVVHLSALNQDGGPFIQIQTFESVSADVPQFKNRVRMGNLTGTVDYASNIYGFATGDDLSITPSTGFRGITSDPTNGVRIFNADLRLYDGSTLMVEMDNTTGLNFDFDTAPSATLGRYVRWLDDLATPDYDSAAAIGGYKDGGNNVLYLYSKGLAATDPTILFDVRLESETFGTGGLMIFNRNALEVRHTSAGTTGIVVTALGGGDPTVQFGVGSGPVWYMGADNSASDRFAINNAALDGLGSAFLLDPTFASFRNWVGIGLGSVAPTAGLTIAAPDNVSSQIRLRSERAAITAGELLGGIDFESNDTSLTAPGTVVARILAIADGTHDATNQRTGLRFFVMTDGSNLYECLRIAHGGHWSMSASANVVTATGSGGPIIHMQGVPMIHMTNTTQTTATDGAAVQFDGSDQFNLINYEAAPIRFLTSNSEQMRVTSAGWLGIGTTTPGVDITGTFDVDTDHRTLHVQGTGAMILARATGASDPAVFSLIHNAASANQKRLTLTTFNGASYMTADGDGGSSDYDFFYLRHDNGYVGIGMPFTGTETLPGARFEVKHTNDGTTNPATRSAIYSDSNLFHIIGRRAGGSYTAPAQVVNGYTLAGFGAQGYTSSGWGSVASAQMLMIATQSFTATAQGTEIQFYVTKNSTATQSLALKLGDDRQLIAPGVNNHTTAIAANVNVDTTAGATEGFLRKVSSSRAIKRDIRTLEDTAGLIDRLRPVTFKPLLDSIDPQRDYPGFIAEEVHEAGGQLFVTYNEEGLPQSVMYDRFTALLVVAVQQLRKQKKEDDRRMRSLEERLERIERKLVA